MAKRPAGGRPEDPGNGLRRALSLLEATIESTADGLLVVDREGRIARYNRRFAEIWRIPAEVLETGEDEKALAFVHDQLRDPEAFLAKVRDLYARPEASSFDTFDLTDGRTLERYSIPQRLDDEIVGRVWSFRDVTVRRRAEEERHRIEAQMRQAQKLESLGVLAGGIAHDFNNLLTAILGNADLALSTLAEDAPARPMLREIEKAARRAAVLCRQMLAYSGQGRFVVRPIDLSRLVDELTGLLESSVSKGTALRIRLAPDLPPVEADVSQMRQVVVNLVVNASEAIGEKSGTIVVTTGIADCRLEDLSNPDLGESLPEGRYAYLEVSDDGCGMDRETIGRIFDPFFSTKFTGRGLGLPAVLGIVRGHRGTIRVDSESGRGTTVRVLLPALAGAEAAPAPREAAPAGAPEPTGVILLVDDEESVRDVGSQMLESAGFRAIVAADGVEALGIARESRGEIACVVLDLTMPRLGGEETLRELRRFAPDLPVILSSGYDIAEATARFAEGDLAGFVQKPYRLASLLAEIRRVLSR